MTADTATISLATEQDQADWDAFVARPDTSASAYHRWDWKQVFGEALKAPTAYFLARSKANEVVGILPLVQLKSRLFGNYFVSVPYANFGGAVALDAEIEQALMNAAGSHANSQSATHIEFRDSHERSGWSPRLDKVEMIRPLETDAETMMSNLGAKLRAQVKRPIREGAVSERGGSELLQDFYNVFARNMRDLGTPVHSRKFFAAILDCMGKDAEIVIVRINQQAVAAGLLIHHKQRTEIPSASSLREFNRTGVNMFLYAECLKAAIERGSTEFDFGRSSPDSGTYRFKKQWGAKPQQLYWHYWLAPGQQPPNLSPSNPKYELAIRAWTRLPVWLTKLIGPPIVSKLP